MAENTYFSHSGSTFPTPQTNQNPALRFFANYVKRINSADYACSWLPYYHPRAIFHDTTGVDYVGGAAIWEWITGLFSKFDRIDMELRDCFVVSKPNGTHLIYGEWMSHFWLKGSGEEVRIPRSMVFLIGKAEGEGVEGQVGFEGLQIVDVRLYYDRSLLLKHVPKSKQEVEASGEKA